MRLTIIIILISSCFFVRCSHTKKICVENPSFSKKIEQSKHVLQFGRKYFMFVENIAIDKDYITATVLKTYNKEEFEYLQSSLDESQSLIRFCFLLKEFVPDSLLDEQKISLNLKSLKHFKYQGLPENKEFSMLDLKKQLKHPKVVVYTNNDTLIIENPTFTTTGVSGKTKVFSTLDTTLTYKEQQGLLKLINKKDIIGIHINKNLTSTSNEIKWNEIDNLTYHQFLTKRLGLQIFGISTLVFIISIGIYGPYYSS